MKEHNGEVVEWNMDAVEYPRGNLQRQAKEAHIIQQNSHKNLLNRKGEWGQNLPPRMTLEDQGGPAGGRDGAQAPTVQPLGQDVPGEPQPSRKRPRMDEVDIHQGAEIAPKKEATEADAESTQMQGARDHQPPDPGDPGAPKARNQKTWNARQMILYMKNGRKKSERLSLSIENPKISNHKETLGINFQQREQTSRVHQGSVASQMPSQSLYKGDSSAREGHKPLETEGTVRKDKFNSEEDYLPEAKV